MTITQLPVANCVIDMEIVNPLYVGIIVTTYIQSPVHDLLTTTNKEETLFQYFLVITRQYWKDLFSVIDMIYIYPFFIILSSSVTHFTLTIYMSL